MKKLENIIKDVAAGVRNEMEDSIRSKVRRLHFEKSYGEAYVDVDYLSPSVVMVSASHIDTAHRSPLLEGAILDALPDWYEVYNDIMEQERQTA